MTVRTITVTPADISRGLLWGLLLIILVLWLLGVLPGGRP